MQGAQEKLGSVSGREVAAFFWPRLRSHAPSFVLGFCLILLNTAIEVSFPLLIGIVVDKLLTASAYASVSLETVCWGFLSLVLLKVFLETAQSWVIQTSGQRITFQLRAEVFHKILRLPIPYFDRHPTGRLLTRVVNDIKSLSELFTASISVLVLDVFIIVGTMVAMLGVHTSLAAATLVSFPFVIWVIYHFGERLGLAYRKVRVQLSEINAFLGENIGAIATVQRLSAETARQQRFEEVVLRHESAQMETLRVFASVQPYANVLNGVAMSTVLFLGGKWVVEGHITPGIVVAFLGYVRNLYQPVRDLVEKYNTALAALVSAERVMNVLQEPGEDLEGGRDVGESAFGVTFSRVGFSYPTTSGSALRDVSFTVPHGKSLAVVGATGSGKSTLIRLLLRFYEATEGEITLGSIPLREWSKSRLRASIGVIHQEVFLFEGSLRENLVLGRAGISEEEVRRVLERVQLWEFVRERGGLDLRIFEGGSNLSVGEKQLIAFARVLLANPPFLVFDEATASLDKVTERKLMAALDSATAGRTSIVIAHRLSTLQRCDQILVLNEGTVHEQGTYGELLQRGGIFAEFHELSRDS